MKTINFYNPSFWERLKYFIGKKFFIYSDFPANSGVLLATVSVKFNFRFLLFKEVMAVNIHDKNMIIKGE